MIASAVNALFSEGVADELPFGGDVEDTVKNVMPCMEDIFQMPTLRPKKGTKEWLQFMTQHLEECSFEDLVDFPWLGKYYWKHHVQTDKDGRPRLKNSDVLSWSTYAPLKPKGLMGVCPCATMY